MLTRSQVARRLGKSIATIRRIEGVLLHPEPDARGVHRFSEEEVNELVEKVVGGEVSLWAEMNGDAGLQRREPDVELDWTSRHTTSKLRRENTVLRALVMKLCSSPELVEQVLSKLGVPTR